MIAPFRTFMHLTGDDERRRALSAAAGLLAEGGQFIFDVFEPSAADIRATHDRWIARREGISERPLWDAEERRLELDVRLPGRIVSMTLEWRNAAEWRELCREAGLDVVAAYAGFDGIDLIDQTGDQVYVCTRAELGARAARRAPARPRSPRSATRRPRPAGCAPRRPALARHLVREPVRSPPSANATGAFGASSASVRSPRASRAITGSSGASRRVMTGTE